jgi:hypothetical protein
MENSLAMHDKIQIIITGTIDGEPVDAVLSQICEGVLNKPNDEYHRDKLKKQIVNALSRMKYEIEVVPGE